MGSKYSQLSMEGLRQCVRPEVADMPAEDLEQIVESSISELPDGTAEDFIKSLRSLGSAVGPALQRAAPGIAQGAATGATVGGPWGAFIGAGAGLASSLGGKGTPPKQAAPALPATTPPPTSAQPEPAPALPTGPSAAATLLALFQNPTVRDSLFSQTLGSFGKQNVASASGASLPRGAINSLLTQLLANATEGLVESDLISEQGYLQGESGEYLIDPASPEQQAAVVLSHLQSGAPHSQSDAVEFIETVETVEWMSEDAVDAESDEWTESEEITEMARFY